MAKFDAEALGKRLEVLNREQLTAIEKLSEALLHEMQRKDPVRVSAKHRERLARDPEKRAKDPSRRQQLPRARRRGEQS